MKMTRTRIGIICTAVLLLAGCGDSVPDMTDEQENAISEYAAITLLKYDANARSRLVDLSRIEEPPVLPALDQEPIPEPEQKPDVQDVPVMDNSSADVMSADSLENFLELPEGVSLSFSEYGLSDSYQEGDNQYFALDATEGKVLLVLHFSLQNASGTDQGINLLDRRDVYRITVNGSYTRTALPTMLSNDLSTYRGTLAANAAEDVVLLIEVNPEDAENMESISLNLKNESKTYTIQLL